MTLALDSHLVVVVIGHYVPIVGSCLRSSLGLWGKPMMAQCWRGMSSPSSYSATKPACPAIACPSCNNSTPHPSPVLTSVFPNIEPTSELIEACDGTAELVALNHSICQVLSYRFHPRRLPSLLRDTLNTDGRMREMLRVKNSIKPPALGSSLNEADSLLKH